MSNRPEHTTLRPPASTASTSRPAPAPAPAPAWAVGGASVRGASHHRRGTPNQDAIAWAPVTRPGATARHFIAAISDGHGAPAHHRSDVGAQLAVEAALSVLEWFIAPNLDPDAPDSQGHDAADLPAQIVAAWQHAVTRHTTVLAGSPADDWVEPLHDKLLAYGATLIAAAVTPELAIAIQIGDGDLAWGFPDGRIERPLPDDQGLVGEQTHSLCAIDAPAHARLKLLRAAAGDTLPDFVMLSTDGVAKSFADERAFRGVVTHYRDALRSEGLPPLLEPLPAWLDKVSQGGSGDDATLCIAGATPAPSNPPMEP